MCSQIPLKERSQIRKVMLQKWIQNGSTVFITAGVSSSKSHCYEQIEQKLVLSCSARVFFSPNSTLLCCPQIPKLRHSLRTKITRVPCRRRDEGSIPRAEKLGDLITAEHKILNEGSESLNNHQYSVVVKDLATQWLQSYPCETKSSQEAENVTKVSPVDRQAEIMYTENSWNLAKLVKHCLGIIKRQHVIDPR